METLKTEFPRVTAEQIKSALADATEIEFDMPPHYFLVNRFVRVKGVGELLAVEFFMAIGVTPEMLRPFFPNAKPGPFTAVEDDYHRLGAFLPSEEMFVGLAQLIGKPVRLTVGPDDKRALIRPDRKVSQKS
jgi:hypothetical protein